MAFRIFLCCFIFGLTQVRGQIDDSSVFPQHSPVLTDLPPYETVLDALTTTYYPELPEEDYLAISRQPEGYFVGIQEHGEVYPEKYWPYWLPGDPGPRQLPFAKRDQPFPHYATETAGFWRLPAFERHLFYGYPDFTTDAIAVIEQVARPSDQQRKWLARAHEEHAMNLLNNQYGTSAPINRFYLDESREQRLNEKQYAEYLHHIRQSATHYAALPDSLGTPVGDPRVKATHQYLNAYLTLLQYHTPSTAMAAANEALTTYDDHLLLSAKLLLESCPSNAILLTEGDNDTYPLLYLQLTQGFRTDVLVVNRHLLHFPRYVGVLRRGEQIGGPLPLSSPQENIRSWAKDTYLPGNRGVVVDAPNALSVLAKLTPLSSGSTEAMARLPFGAIKLTDHPEGPIFRSEARVLNVGELVTLDLIASSLGKRPVTVAATVDQRYFAYSNSWQQIGLVYDLANERSTSGIDLAATHAWSQLLLRDRPLEKVGSQSTFFLTYLEELFVRASRYLENYGEANVAIELVDRYLSHLDRRVIFSRPSSFALLRRMHELGYDPVLLTAYLGILRERLGEIGIDQLSQNGKRTMVAIDHYLATGTFPSLLPPRN